MALTKVQSDLLGAGSVLQVVQGNYSTQVGNSTNVMADTGLSATITPKFSTSKILILVSHSGVYKNQNATGNAVNFSIVRNSTVLNGGTTLGYLVGYNGIAQIQTMSCAFNWLDSPSTTSATTYKTQFANYVNASAVYVQLDSATTSTITLMEIAA